MDNGTSEIKRHEAAVRDAALELERIAAQHATVQRELAAVERGEKTGDSAELTETLRLKAAARTAAEKKHASAESALYGARVQQKSAAWVAETQQTATHLATLALNLQLECIHLMELQGARLNEFNANGVMLEEVTGLPGDFAPNLANLIAQQIRGTGVAGLAPNFELRAWIKANVKADPLPGRPTMTLVWADEPRPPVDPNARTEPYPMGVFYGGTLIGYAPQ